MLDELRCKLLRSDSVLPWLSSNLMLGKGQDAINHKARMVREKEKKGQACVNATWSVPFLRIRQIKWVTITQVDRIRIEKGSDFLSFGCERFPSRGVLKEKS